MVACGRAFLADFLLGSDEQVGQLDPPPSSGSARPSGSAWPSRAFPKSIGGVGEPLRHNQPSGPSEFELGRGLPQELGRASIMEESSVLRIADGQQDAARRAQRRPAPGGAPQPDRLRRPGRSSSRRLECCRKVAPLFYVCPRLRPRRGLHRRSGGDDDAGAPAASRPPLGGRICSWWRSTACAEEPSPEATRVTCSCKKFAAGRSGCASDLGPLLGGQPDARDAGPAVSRCVCGL